LSRTLTFILVISVIFTIYGFANYYIFARGLHALMLSGTYRTVFMAVFVLLAVSFIASVFLERADIISIGKPLSWIGAFWLAAFVYFLLILAFIDLLRLANHFTHFFPAFLTDDPARTARITAYSVITLVTAIVVYGFINAHIIRVRTLEINVPKDAGGRRTLNIAMASDIHLSSIINSGRIKASSQK